MLLQLSLLGLREDVIVYSGEVEYGHRPGFDGDRIDFSPKGQIGSVEGNVRLGIVAKELAFIERSGSSP